ncbi:SPOR domain-containing protein [Limnobacter parvus]|uniref:SPOR domain-containing protein n=1 Tax=Limnobacter parvus TaxID=2939690 RepID=A0ABT1XIG9_9BURK|nr:SPOR domain-containing protein [Limnobacter parvus]MCR2747072.1 SPOR domain-containing protein [Limnobacter parvus]
MAQSKSAQSKAKPQAHKSKGNAIPAFVFGMVFGLLIALGVALFVSKSELPFSGAETQGAVAKVSPGPGNNPPDPNSAIYGKANANQGNVVTADPFQQGTEPQTADSTPTEQVEPVAQTVYFLQLGSFRNREDAEQLRAQLAFVGTESEIAVGEVNGNIVNRVRVGPFVSANEAYQARIPLTKGGFEATVVKE